MVTLCHSLLQHWPISTTHHHRHLRHHRTTFTATTATTITRIPTVYRCRRRCNQQHRHRLHKRRYCKSNRISSAQARSLALHQPVLLLLSFVVSILNFYFQIGISNSMMPSHSPYASYQSSLSSSSSSSISSPYASESTSNSSSNNNSTNGSNNNNINNNNNAGSSNNEPTTDSFAYLLLVIFSKTTIFLYLNNN